MTEAEKRLIEFAWRTQRMTIAALEDDVRQARRATEEFGAVLRKHGLLPPDEPKEAIYGNTVTGARRGDVIHLDGHFKPGVAARSDGTD